MSRADEAERPSQAKARCDVAVVGGGHNGLVAATLLARAGLDVVVVERADVLGGAARTEEPFPKVPGLRCSTGSYLLGLAPPELLRLLDLDLPLMRRDPHYFLPTQGPRHLLLGSDREAARASLRAAFGDADLAADDALAAELTALRDDLAPAWLLAPRSVDETAEEFIRPALRERFVDLCRGSVADYLDRFGFTSSLLPAMYAVTDGLSGLSAGPHTPGTGHNFLVHNMCRLPGADGTWMIVRGGMGTVAAALTAAAQQAGAELRTSAEAVQILTADGVATGVAFADGSTLEARAVVGGCDPFRLADLVGDAMPAPFVERLDAVRMQGSTLKLNLALRDLPTFTSLPERVGQHAATVHLLPQVDDVMAAVSDMWAEVERGALPEFPTIEWYTHTAVDGSLQDPADHHSGALFVQSVPYAPAGTTWDAALPGYVEKLLAVCDLFAPGTSDLVVDTCALPPPAIEARFGITGGHIHHVDNTVAFADRIPYRTGLDGLYAASAATHPGGSVIGAAGHNAAQQVLADLGVASELGRTRAEVVTR